MSQENLETRVAELEKLVRALVNSSTNCTETLFLLAERSLEVNECQYSTVQFILASGSITNDTIRQSAQDAIARAQSQTDQVSASLKQARSKLIILP